MNDGRENQRTHVRMNEWANLTTTVTCVSWPMATLKPDTNHNCIQFYFARFYYCNSNQNYLQFNRKSILFEIIIPDRFGIFQWLAWNDDAHKIIHWISCEKSNRLHKLKIQARERERTSDGESKRLGKESERTIHTIYYTYYILMLCDTFTSTSTRLLQWHSPYTHCLCIVYVKVNLFENDSLVV